ncbi:protein flp [Aplysia californica]|uniref:Protein flp n=1 Tax=Aplysia californica TaxID=6500 RepID=A0ABM0JAY2_APLCA|nr:protein flp [Aplysia californica]
MASPPHWCSLRAVLSFLLTLLCSRALCAESFDAAEIDSVISKTFECHNNPGLAVSVVRNGQVLFSGGYGVEEKDTQEPVTDNTVFGIASVSKGFAATLLVKLLYEKTNLTVDSKVRELLGDDFKMPDDFRTSEMTFADLMAHRTGVPANNRIRFSNNLTRENLKDYFPLLPAPHQFRVKYFYSNIMYGLITRLAEIVGGASWEQLIRENLFEPLGMENSTFLTDVDWSGNNVATAYSFEKTGEIIRVPHEFSRRWALLAGSGAVMTTANDMTRWMHFHLYGGENPGGRQVMKEKHLDEVHEPRFLITPTVSKDTRVPRFPVTSSEDVYAHGFRRGYYRGYERLTHTGSTIGYRAMLSLLPKHKIGVFTVMTGKDDSYKYRVPLHMYLLDRALGFQSWLNSSTICSYPKPWKTAKKSSPPPKLDASLKLQRDIEEYEGTYHNPAYGYLEISYNKTLTSLVMTFGWGIWRLFPRPKLSGDKFYGDGLDITVAFDISPIEFLGASDNETHIVAVKATAFEPTVPPVFEKVGLTKPGNFSPAFGCSSLTYASSFIMVIWLMTLRVQGEFF